MIKLNRRYKGKNPNNVYQRGVVKKEVTHYSTPSPPTQAERAMDEGNRKLRALEQEQESYERVLKKINEIEEFHEMENQRDIYRLEDIREMWKEDSRQLQIHSEIQSQLVKMQMNRRQIWEERDEEKRRMRIKWLEEEDDIYETMRKEAEKWRYQEE